LEFNTITTFTLFNRVTGCGRMDSFTDIPPWIAWVGECVAIIGPGPRRMPHDIKQICVQPVWPEQSASVKPIRVTFEDDSIPASPLDTQLPSDKNTAIGGGWFPVTLSPAADTQLEGKLRFGC
jgi:hypothetical protein